MQNDITQLLESLHEGNPNAVDQIFPLIYNELHRLARGLFVQERPNHTLQPTAVVHEAYVRLVGADLKFENRAHFFRIAAGAMRNLLIDYARAHAREAGGIGEKMSLDDEDTAIQGLKSPEELIRLHEALKELAQEDERQSQIVELRYFAGFTMEQTAEILQISRATVAREWFHARAWLLRALETS